MIGISVKDFSIAFGDTTILENVSFSVEVGEIFTILGPSGCGKSTILRSIASLQENFKGKILLNETCEIGQIGKCNSDIGYIFQDYALFPHLNVQQNIEFALDKLKKHERQKKLDQLLKQFDLIEHRHKQIHELSGGQQQRVSIARVIAYEPKILLLDEPFSNLDSILRNKTKNWLKGLIKELGLSAILVTHDQKEALSMSDRIAIINDKTIIQSGTPQELFHQPNSLYVAQFLGDINQLPLEYAKACEKEAIEYEHIVARVNQTAITHENNGFELSILDSSYCGDYIELEMLLIEYDMPIMARIHNFETYDLQQKIYLSIQPKNIITIPSN